jgi:hypothetical protein
MKNDYKNMGPFVCGHCAETCDVVNEMEEYCDQTDGRTVELCTNCREDYERETGKCINSDTLEPDEFDTLMRWLTPESEHSETEMTPYEATLAGLEAGAAGIRIELNNGKITVYHSEAGAILLKRKKVKAGTWKALWALLENSGKED